MVNLMNMMSLTSMMSRTLRVALALLFVLAASSASAQTCPASAGGVPLARPARTGGVQVDQEMCATANGRKVCSKLCAYGSSLSGLDVWVFWVPEAPPTMAPPTGMCTDKRLSTEPNSQKSQARATWTPEPFPEGKLIALQLLQAAAGKAVPCPGAASESVVDRGMAGDVVGWIVGFEGDVWVLLGGSGRRVKITEKDFVVAEKDRIITGPASRARIQFVFSDPGARYVPTDPTMVINFGANTELDVQRFYAKLDAPREYGGLFDLIKGYIRYWTTGFGGSSAFSVKGGATVCGTRGTDVATSYDPATRTFTAALHEGAATLRQEGSDLVRNLSAGQEITIVNGVYSTPRALSAARWESLISPLELPAGAAPGVFAAAADFSATTNPNGPWTYGWAATLGAPFVASTDHRMTQGLGTWRSGRPPDGYPTILHNGTQSPINFSGTARFEPGQVALHPGPAGEYAIARWTAPQAGTIALASAFTGLDTVGPTSTDVHVLHNGRPVFDGFVQGAGPASAAPFKTTLTVRRGDTIDFAVGFGKNRTYGWDSTGLVATVTVVR